MKKLSAVTLLSISVVVSGCASNGGFVTGTNSTGLATSGNNSDGCSMGVSSGVGALLGAAAGYAISKHGNNSSAQNNRAIALGALAGGAISAGICMAINANTVQKKSATDVEQQYKALNGSLPDKTKIEQYKTTLIPGAVASTNNNIVVKSDLRVIEGKNDILRTIKETLVLKDSSGKVLKTLTKDVSQTGSFGSGEFENSFAWKFPASVSKGQYTIETELSVNGNKVASQTKSLTLV